MTRRKPGFRSVWSRLVFAGVLLLALAIRLYALVPPSVGLQYGADVDEAIYCESGQLVWQGIWPYRDYFTAMSPGGFAFFSLVQRPFSHPWGSPVGFMAQRYASVCLGVATVAVIYLLGMKVGGPWSALLAALLLAVDSGAVSQDRRAMLESLLNVFSALAVLAASWAMPLAQRASPRRGLLVGALGALAIASKSTGLAVAGAILIYAALRWQWRMIACILLGMSVAYLLIALPTLLCCPLEMVKQVYLFQYTRPFEAQGSQFLLRTRAILGYQGAWLTVRLGLLGLGVSLLRIIIRRRDTGWGLGACWLLAVILVLLANRPYYHYYYSALAPPLALLGGSLLPRRLPKLSRPWQAGERLLAARWLAFLAILALSAYSPFWGSAIWRQAQALRTALTWTKPGYNIVAEELSRRSSPGDVVFAFEPNYAFLASRPLARTPDGQFVVESHGHTLYLNMDLDEAGWVEVPILWLQRPPGDEAELLLLPKGQESLRGAFGSADWLIVDRRARRVLSPENLAFMEAHSTEVFTYADVALRHVAR